MRTISKNKAKGTEYNELKNIKKAKRIVKEKEDRRRTENKRLNSEARKEKALEKEFYNKIREIEIIEYSKGMLFIKINNEIEKRNLTYGRRNIKLSENLDLLPFFQLKIFGEMIELKELKNFDDMKEKISWAISENI